MTQQIRFLVINPMAWDYEEEWSEWKTYGGTPQYVPDNAIKFEFREKPSFEPGYFMDVVSGTRPLEIFWWDEDPDDSKWERVTVHNDHLDYDED